MKRGKDEEKTMGPMFPRLHVNDAEKGGGPRAPPRNKMALYEQLSIPSQRFSHSVLPINPYSASANSVPHWTQSSGNERSTLSSFHQQLPKSKSDNKQGQYSDMSSSLTQIDQRKKMNEDDFIVPNLVHARTFQARVKNADNTDRKDAPIVNSSFISQSLECSNFTGSGVIGHIISKQERKPQKEETLTTRSELVIVVSTSSINETTEGPHESTSLSLSHELGKIPSNCVNLQKTGNRERYSESQPTGGNHNAVALREHSSTRSFPLKDGNILRGAANDHEDRLCRPQQMEKLDRVNSVTEASVVNAVLGLNVSPDEVVGMIGQKHFWKARRAITNQQRVFASQIFELHRLVKVQKGITLSTHVLEDVISSCKNITPALPKDPPSDHPHRPAKELPNASNQESVLENPIHKNSLHKPSVPVIQTNEPPSSYRPSSQSVSSDHCPRWWGFTQPQGQHQWLIPVMSPSEGLVYKPYPGHGFSGTVYGGYNLPGSNQMINNFSSHPQYQLQQPFPSPAAHAYFPSHDMPIMNTMVSSSSVEQTNTPDMPGQISAKEVHRGIRNTNILSRPTPRGTALPDGNPHASEDIEVQGSTASSTNERPQESGVLKARNVLSFFPTSTASDPDSSSVPHHLQPKHFPPQVIKAVPHHSKSATESAKRIFKSIIEERKQYGYL